MLNLLLTKKEHKFVHSPNDYHIIHKLNHRFHKQAYEEDKKAFTVSTYFDVKEG